jgi:DHA2 family multidrug resistance protein
MSHATMPSGRAVNPWWIGLTLTLATFMELLDTSIANVALPHIAGGLGTSLDEATWVLTSYLVANAVVLPLSAWLSRTFGRKTYYMACVALFTFSSFLCGVAPNLGLLIFFRVLQGVAGGGLAPSEQAMLVDAFPPAKRAAAFGLYSMAIVLAPALGPTLGGWITDHSTWRWIFFINLPVGFLSLFLTSRLVTDPPAFIEERRRLKASGTARVDYVGMLLIAVGFGCLEVVLDKGQEEDWFGSPFITAFTVISVMAWLPRSSGSFTTKIRWSIYPCWPIGTSPWRARSSSCSALSCSAAPCCCLSCCKRSTGTTRPRRAWPSRPAPW